MTSDSILTTYRNVAAITAQMLAAARTGDWEQLALLEMRCSGQVASLMNGEGSLALSGPDRDRKVELIRKILADDQEIRTLTEPWMKQLSALLNSAGAERRLARAYNSYPKE